MLGTLVVAVILAQPFPRASTGGDLCSRVASSIAREGYSWSLAQEEDPKTGFAILVGETPVFSSLVKMAPGDLEAIGGKQRLSAVTFALRGATGETVLPGVEEAGYRDCESVGLSRRHVARELPPPGVYQLAVRVPGCAWSATGWRFRVRVPATEREKAYVALRNLEAVRGDGPAVKRNMEVVLASSLPLEVIMGAASIFYLPHLREGRIGAPPPLFCARSREFHAKNPSARGPYQVAWERSCEVLEKGGPWRFEWPAGAARTEASSGPSDGLSEIVTSAEAAYREDRLSEASEGFRRALQANSADPEANLGYGKVLLAQGARGAASYLEKGMPARADDAEKRYCLANALWAEGRKEEALANYRGLAFGDRGELGLRVSQMLRRMGELKSDEEEGEAWRRLNERRRSEQERGPSR